MATRYLIAIAAICAMGGEASACNYCRQGYRVYHAPQKIIRQVVEKKVYVPTTNVIFNNAYPAAAPSQTSYQAFSSSYTPSAQTFATLSQQALTIAGQNSQLAQQQAQTEAGLAALQLQTNQVIAVTEHLRAGLAGAQGGGSQTLVLQIGADGSVRQVTPEQVQQPPPTPQPQGSVIADRCAKCHSGAQPKGEFYLDGQAPVSDEAFRRIMQVLNAGTMPPESEPELTGEEKSVILDELLSLTQEN